MATYTELRGLFDNSALRNRVAVAVIIAANGILDDPAAFPSVGADAALQAKRKAWAARAFGAPDPTAGTVLMAVLAANSSATVSQINGATDTVIQNNVNAVVDLLAETM